jgi:hypothetical protein
MQFVYVLDISVQCPRCTSRIVSWATWLALLDSVDIQVGTLIRENEDAEQALPPNGN